jgi:eukaryotic-like serine/threonine-protein kinase
MARRPGSRDPSSLPPLPEVGSVIAGKYAIVRVLGEGGMGVVYEARHVRLRQNVALKTLLPSMLEHDVIISRFEREARSAGQLRSRHTARVMDVDTTSDGLPYMVMELLSGHDLAVELERRTCIPVGEAADILLQACAAMIEAHSLGIIHRDLKPSNLFLEAEDGGRIVKVLDFGISKVQNERDAKLTDANVVVGTAMYMSPEQVRASHSVDARTDIWALGVILYEMLAGRAPWMGTPTQVAAAIVTEDAPDVRAFCQLPNDVAFILQKALQRRPEHRFNDVRELVAALAPFAPPRTPGRVFADNLFAASPSQGCVSIVPASGANARSSSDTAPTVINADAISEARMRPNDRTAPGWSQGGTPPKRARAALVGAGVAGLVLVVVAGGVFLASRNARERPIGDPSASANAAPLITEPLPPAIDPPPPVTAKAEEPAPSASVAVAPRNKPGAARPSATASAKPPVTLPPKPTASANDKPLFL